MKSKLRKPSLIMLLGMPGSGKTYLSRQLAKKLGVVHLNADRLRHELFQKPSYTQEEEGVVKHIMLMMTEQFLQAGVSVIYDASQNRLADRREMREIARKLKATPILIWQQIDTQSSFARVVNRSPETNPDDKYSPRMDKELFVSLSQGLQQPNMEDAIVISGKHSFNGQFQTIVRSLHEMQLLASDNKLSQKVPNPGLVNLVSQNTGRVDHQRRNISVN